MGVTISYLPGMMEHVTGRVPTGEILGLDSPDRFHVKYSAGGLVVLAQIADWKENEEPDLAKSQVKQALIYFEGFNLVRAHRHESLVQRVMTLKDTGWGTPDNDPLKVEIKTSWPDNNRERAYFAAKADADKNLWDIAKRVFGAGVLIRDYIEGSL